VKRGSSERAKVEPTGYDAIQLSRAKRSPQRSRNEPQAGISNAVVSCINREVKKNHIGNENVAKQKV